MGVEGAECGRTTYRPAFSSILTIAEILSTKKSPIC